jgi:pimeloyl-ACP methyl ester carboxylesterase
MSIISKTPIVFACGQLLDERCWEPQSAAFADQRNLFVSDHRSDDTIAGMAKRLLTSAPDQFLLVGHAMGGFIALEVMRQAPERVKGLALLATLANADGPAQTERRMGYIRLVEEGRFEQVAEERIQMLLAPARRSDPVLTGQIRAMSQDTGAEIFLRQQRAIMSRIDSRPSLGAITVPTLILWGEEDGITTMAQQRDMLDGISGSRLEVLKGCGHLSTLEAPSEVNARLSAWMEGL